ncbi:hypothetical protein O181_080033 [Austropuccinia psidii MF-1]|uniref:Uncharacterized protein n=1 Tax=Austropuccinia psidii MF-1 TaxID=1389203 RepID=A0A9Q3FHX1_9BASI|nr:hypothetical protein [Austropuccinia psidii MF-1]
MSEFMIHRKILRQFGGYFSKSRTTEQPSAEDIIDISEEVTTRTRIGSSRVNLKPGFNKYWKDYVDKNIKENSNNIKKAKINEVDIEKEPYVEKDDVIKDNSDDKSSIFAESSNDRENINVTFEIMEYYYNFPQLSNSQLDFSKVHDAKLMKTKPNRGKVYTAGNSCITGVLINNEPTEILLGPGDFFSCVGNSFLKACVPDFEDQLLPIEGIKFNSSSNHMNSLGIFEATVIFPIINGSLRICQPVTQNQSTSMTAKIP